MVGSLCNTLANQRRGSLTSLPGGEKPFPRADHVLVTAGDHIILLVRVTPSPSPLVVILCRFGGADCQSLHNDTWLFDVSTRKWTELRCTGSIPSPHLSHAAALVDDDVYVFGGRGVDGRDPGDLTVFKLSSKWFGLFNPMRSSFTRHPAQRWSMPQNLGPSPSGRRAHTMASIGTQVF